MARTASGSAIEKERWQVRLSPGCTVEMTVDQLDVAFDAGTVGAKTEVRPPGSLRFTTLGEAARLDDVPHESPHSVAPFAADVAPASSESLVSGETLSAEPSPPRGRRAGRVGSVIAIVLMFLVLIAIGMGGGAYAARPAEMRAKVAALRAKITASPRAVVVVAAPPPPPPKIVEPPPAPPPPPAAVSSPSPATTTVDHLPNASDKGAKVKGKAPLPAKSKPRK